LRRELTEAASLGKKGGGAGERGFEVSKAGDTRVGLVGFPSVGKSTLLTKVCIFFLTKSMKHLYEQFT
jgi:ribosome-interacting GTPase 1